MHNYSTNDHTPTRFDTIVSSSGSLYTNLAKSHKCISNAVVGNTIYN